MEIRKLRNGMRKGPSYSGRCNVLLTYAFCRTEWEVSWYEQYYAPTGKKEIYNSASEEKPKGRAHCLGSAMTQII